MTNEELEAHRKAFYLANGHWPPRGKRALAHVVAGSEPAPTSPPQSPFDAAYATPSGPEAAVWDDRGYCRWTLPVCSMGSRPTPPRN